jgi:hypothetical protein
VIGSVAACGGAERLVNEPREEAGNLRSQCMHGFDDERINACMHYVTGMQLAKGYLSKFMGEISYSKPCLGIHESPKTQGINGRREYLKKVGIKLASLKSIF